MKKALFTTFLAVVVIAAVLIYRAGATFEDRQLEPAAGLTTVAIDESLAIERFAGALRIPTVSFDDRSNFDAAAFRDFKSFLEASYPLVDSRAQLTVINDYSLVYHLPGSDPSLKPVLFMGHMDVVPIEEITRSEWSYPPFGGTVADGIIWGRGSVDDKFTVIALMEAMEQLLSENIQPERSIYLAFGHDEEVGGKDGAAKVAEYFEQKGITFDYVMDEGGAVLEGMMEGLDRPVAIIGVSEKGYVNLVLTVKAPGGHSSQPPRQTAVGILSRAIVAVEDSPFPARLDYIYPTFEALGAEMPFSNRLAMANLWLLSPLVKSVMLKNKDDAPGIRTTTAATMVSGSPKSNILPTRATAVINFRILPGDSVESVTNRVIELIDDERVTVTAEYGVNPSPVSPTDSRGFELIAQTIRGMDDSILVAPYMVRGGTDAKYFYSVSPNVYRFMMLRIDPTTIGYLHGIDEHVAAEDYLEAIRFYYHLIHLSISNRKSL
ncbi:MAG: M20/M25/M40 family metallo-hydrolase [Xanthomonadales bacterium]|nr:M20 family peptidase [Gammaproteobacteria bacterium]NND57564.1 M20/M25/M40 family metallo-hydrolase [Xanthomonadales bacterium]NNK51288.1 M20/M25/M40 family metallo-hydrolase [Xanthomonadales bacterium]